MEAWVNDVIFATAFSPEREFYPVSIKAKDVYFRC
jgi:hypothetical protein